MGEGSAIGIVAPDGVPEIRPGDDLAALLLPLLDLRDGDILIVTSKIVSKAEGRVRDGDRDSALAEETDRLVARRGPTSIVRTRLGLTMAAAGIDASNVEAGRIVLLPLDPDASARRLREAVLTRTGRVVGVIVTDTAGRAWREGQTDIAVGAAGVRVAEPYGGRVDAYGNELAVTLPAVADEIAGAAELAQHKLGARPVAVLRGRADLVLPADDHGPGAAALVRPEAGDLFGYGAREAVLRALEGRAGDDRGFGAVATPEEIAEGLARLAHHGVEVVGAPGTAPGTSPGAPEEGRLAVRGPREVLEAVAFAHRWRVTRDGDDPPGILRLHPASP